MPTKRSLHLKCDRDAIVVVGGVKKTEFDPANTWRSAFLLVHTTRSAGEPWRWRKLTHMSEGRCRPGVLQLGPPGGNDRIQRVLVAGGWRNTAEILRIDCTDASDRGEWTRIGPLTRELETAFLVALSSRVLAFGELICDFDMLGSR